MITTLAIFAILVIVGLPASAAQAIPLSLPFLVVAFMWCAHMLLATVDRHMGIDRIRGR